MPTAVADQDTMAEPLCHILTPVGMLGYGFNEGENAAVLAGLVASKVPTAIILDSGSTDSGPGRLAHGQLGMPRDAYYRDLSKLLELIDTFEIPLLFSSAGGDGTDEHVAELAKIIEEISAEPQNEHYSIKTIAIFAGVEKEIVSERLRAGKVKGCGPCVPGLTEDDIESSTRIVAQMGPEPFIDAMKAHPDFDVIVGGRAYDPAPYVAYAAYLSGCDLRDWSSEEVKRQLGGFTHMGKIMECGGVCAEPKSHGSVATVYRDGSFQITPTDKKARCTTQSVAAHTLYEKTRPDILPGPGGYLDVCSSTYEQLADGRTVKVRGSVFHALQESGLPYQVKLEAAKLVGYRAMYMGSFHDAILLSQLDGLLAEIKVYLAQQHRNVDGQWEIDWHRYGKPNGSSDSPEVFIIGEVLASSQELATSIADTARIASIHGSYPGQKATSGNFAFGLGGKMTIPLGPCPQFSIYHLMDLEEGEERFLRSEKQASIESNGESTNGTSSSRKSLFSQSFSVIGQAQKKPRPKRDLGKFNPSNEAGPNGSDSTQSSQVSAENMSVIRNGSVAPRTLGDVARYLRSKNSGPYEITLDVMFESKETFNVVKDSEMLCPRSVAELFDLSETDIVWCGFFEPAMAWKATIPRIRAGKRVAGGGFMERDMHGSQQYAPLLNLRLPQEVLSKLSTI